ncbi:unnamed protein product [Sphenostylis stenocarpa]|uniref:RING-type E3 ubiquitin transferase n=1 Tax=Sphenostylis stenocarpa TaxID=92480 RepID=A0AA86SYB8_9FABA|nr:unnamed protein product [Sphenostylis stenocarpa]
MAPEKNIPMERRRFLSLPSVRPCVAISPSVLIASLITLAQNICSFSPNSFTTQRKNARETTRFIAILLALLEELHDRGSFIPDPIRLCLSDLHLTFQKILLLMHDCSREDARIWVLMKSQYIVTQFRVLIRALATTLHVLPLRSMDISAEVKDLVELVTKQTKRGKMELHENDERELKRLRLILDRLERGIEPDVDTVKVVINYLEIKNWSSCNEEVKFLEEELSYNEEEVSLLSNLIGFLHYSRVVLFETIDFQCLAMEQSRAKCSVEKLSCVVPRDFLCPISFEIMTDPVTISTGQTYNRTSIQKWLKSGNIKCPKTQESLVNTELLPNIALKKLIQQFCYDNGVAVVFNRINLNKTRTSSVPAAAHAIQFLSWFISRRLVFGTEEQITKATYEIRLLAKSNVFYKVCLVEMGTVPPLLDLLTGHGRIIQENAIHALMKLSKHHRGQEVIIESRGLAPILNVLRRGLSLEARHVAADIIFYLSSAKEYRKLIGETPNAIPALVAMVKEGTTFGKKNNSNAVIAIFALLLRRENHAKVVAAGAVPALVNVVASSDKPEAVTDSLAVLVALAESTDGAYAVFKAEALPLVSGILQSATSRAEEEYCVSILLALCVNLGEEAIRALVKEASCMPSLYSLITGGTPHASKKARSLVNIIVDFTQNGFTGSSLSRQRILYC